MSSVWSAVKRVEVGALKGRGYSSHALGGWALACQAMTHIQCFLLASLLLCLHSRLKPEREKTQEQIDNPYRNNRAPMPPLKSPPSRAAALVLPLLLLLSPMTTTTATAAITVAARKMLIEATPLVITIEDHYSTNKTDDDLTTPPTATFINGLSDLWTQTNPLTNLDLNAGAEVHVVHDVPAHPDLQIITAVIEVYYRIVASKASSTPIQTPANLRGKRIRVVRNSSARSPV